MNYIIRRGEFYVKDLNRFPGRSEFIWTLYRERALKFSEEELKNSDMPKINEEYELIEVE